MQWQAVALAHWHFHTRVKPAQIEKAKRRRNRMRGVGRHARNLSVIEEEALTRALGAVGECGTAEAEDNEDELNSSDSFDESPPVGAGASSEEFPARYHLTFEGPALHGSSSSVNDRHFASMSGELVPHMPVAELAIFANVEYMSNWALQTASTDRQGFALALLHSSLHYLDKVRCQLCPIEPNGCVLSKSVFIRVCVWARLPRSDRLLWKQLSRTRRRRLQVVVAQAHIWMMVIAKR